MSEIEDVIRVDDPMPTLSHVEKANGPFCLLVKWSKGKRTGDEVIDVSPQIFTFKIYAPLRDDPELFAKVSVSEDGTALVWPGNADLEVSADALAELAEESMTSEKFGQFLREMDFTYEAAAAQLGISRRLVAYYAKEREIPRHISLACEALRARHATERQEHTEVSMTSDGRQRNHLRLVQ